MVRPKARRIIIIIAIIDTNQKGIENCNNKKADKRRLQGQSQTMETIKNYNDKRAVANLVSLAILLP